MVAAVGHSLAKTRKILSILSRAIVLSEKVKEKPPENEIEGKVDTPPRYRTDRTSTMFAQDSASIAPHVVHFKASGDTSQGPLAFSFPTGRTSELHSSAGQLMNCDFSSEIWSRQPKDLP